MRGSALYVNSVAASLEVRHIRKSDYMLNCLVDLMYSGTIVFLGEYYYYYSAVFLAE